jgi:putative flippase GtrA
MNGTGWVTRERVLEMVRFCAVGLGTFLLDEGALIVLHGPARLPLALATALAYTLAALLNFVLSRQWVFEQASNGARPRTALVRYVIVIVIGLLITAALVPALQAIGIDYRVGKVLVSGLVGIANYFAFPMWVFRGSGGDAEPVAAADGSAGGSAAVLEHAAVPGERPAVPGGPAEAPGAP